MPISSQAISVNSQINLSNINIDSDLDMGANSLTINDLSKILINSKSLDKYLSIIASDGSQTYSISGSSYTPFTDGTEYSTNSTGYTTKITTATSSIDNTITDGTYCLVKATYKLKAYNGSYPLHVPSGQLLYNSIPLFNKTGISLNAYTTYTNYAIIQAYQSYNFAWQLRINNSATYCYSKDYELILTPLTDIISLI